MPTTAPEIDSSAGEQAATLKAVAVAGLPFLWLGMVAAISLMEAPLKFHAEGVSRTEALAVGQLVFPALNGAESVLALALLALLWSLRRDAPRTWRLALVTSAVLLLQVAAVRPLVHASTVQVLAGTSDGGSPWHLVYIGLEGIKIVLLLLLGRSAVTTARAV